VKVDEKIDEATGDPRNVTTILYLQRVGKPSSFLRYSDSFSAVGGFIMALYVMFYLFTSCVNRRLLLRSIIEDSYLVNNN
jgi:hypothetical protein